MTQSYNKDHIETVIFTPSSYYNDEPDYARERIVSYENMDELKDKLYSMYEEDEENNQYHRVQQQRVDEVAPQNEEQFPEQQEDTKTPLRSILRNKNADRNDVHPIPMPPPRINGRATPTKKRSTKRRNRLVRFLSVGKGIGNTAPAF